MLLLLFIPKLMLCVVGMPIFDDVVERKFYESKNF